MSHTSMKPVFTQHFVEGTAAQDRELFCTLHSHKWPRWMGNIQTLLFWLHGNYNEFVNQTNTHVRFWMNQNRKVFRPKRRCCSSTPKAMALNCARERDRPTLVEFLCWFKFVILKIQYICVRPSNETANSVHIVSRISTEYPMKAKTLVFVKTSRPILGPNQPLLQRVPGVLAPWKSSRRVILTTTLPLTSEV